MKTVQLAPNVRSSILGFGCAPILGAVGAKTAERALCCALDHGVNHFDVARSYGYGEAESFLGRFFAKRRDEVVIVSKFGIRATWRADMLRPVKPLVRALKNRRKSAGPPQTTPSEPKSGKVPADPFHQRVPLTAAVMNASLDRSLRALRTDHLDLLMVHEPTGALESINELAIAAEELKEVGKIRGWGLAFDWNSHDFLKQDFERFDILQFDCSPKANHYPEAHAERGDKVNLLFSPFRQAGELEPKTILKSMWDDFPQSVVLCSMFNPEHIASNARAAEEAR